MKIYNIMESIVQAEIKNICADIEKNGEQQGICTCAQCRLDAACYVLNRLPPRYIVSNRGLTREEHFSFERQQEEADIISLILQALKTVGHNRRHNVDHLNDEDDAQTKGKLFAKGTAVFNIPAIVGRIFNGFNFDPIVDSNVGLYTGGKLIEMKNANWQNPCFLSKQTEGTFTFWPHYVSAKKKGEQKVFEFSIHAEAEGFEPLNHHFEIPLISEELLPDTFSREQTFHVPELYMFPPEETM